MDQNIVKETFLTTNDNPYNPFKEFKDWYYLDQQLGYNTCSLIDRMFKTFNVDEESLNEETKEKLIVEAIRKIVSIQPEVYKIVTNDTYVDTIPSQAPTAPK